MKNEAHKLGGTEYDIDIWKQFRLITNSYDTKIKDKKGRVKEAELKDGRSSLKSNKVNVKTDAGKANFEVGIMIKVFK